MWLKAQPPGHMPAETAAIGEALLGEDSVLSEFRDRLLGHEAEGRVFDHLVSEFRAWGLITERGQQRTDSIAMLTKVRRLSRLELVVETLRMAVGALLKADRAWGERVIPPS